MFFLELADEIFCTKDGLLHSLFKLLSFAVFLVSIFYFLLFFVTICPIASIKFLVPLQYSWWLLDFLTKDIGHQSFDIARLVLQYFEEVLEVTVFGTDHLKILLLLETLVLAVRSCLEWIGQYVKKRGIFLHAFEHVGVELLPSRLSPWPQ